MPNNEKSSVVRGLKGVAAAETRISYVHPEPGQLYYAGYNIDDIYGRVSFEEVVHLLWTDRLPNRSELDNLRSRLIHEMRLPNPIIRRLKDTLPDSHPMDILRTTVSHLGEIDPDRNDNSRLANERKAIRLTAQVPTTIAALHNIRSKETMPNPDSELNFASNVLHMFLGRDLDKLESRIFDDYMVLHAEHGLSNSTFVGRTTVSTKSDMHSGITSAIGSLKGSLHGGAVEYAKKMLDEIHVDEAEVHIKEILDKGLKVYGFGHPIYKTADPRTKYLKKMAEILCKQTGKLDNFKKIQNIEEVVRQMKNLVTNVDFYAGTVLDGLGIPPEYFTTFFATSRTPGWASHIEEQYEANILIRPSSEYRGEFGRRFIPIRQRP